MGHFKKESDRFFATHDRPLTGDHSCVESEKNSRERQGTIVERFLDLGHFYFPDQAFSWKYLKEEERRRRERAPHTPVDRLHLCNHEMLVKKIENLPAGH